MHNDPDLDTNNFDHGDDLDLDAADRGDNLDGQEELEPETEKPTARKPDTEGEEEEEPDKDGKPRTADGRFAKKGEDAESDEDEDEDEDEGEEEEEEEDDAARAKNLPIRLNKMKEQRDSERAAREAAEQRAAELEAQLKAGSSKDAPEAKDPAEEINAALEDLYEQVEDARADGDTKLAAKLQREIDAGNRKLATLEATRVAQRVTAATTEHQRFDSMLDRMEATIEELNPNSDDFDPGAVKDLEELVSGYQNAGLSPTKALAKAVKLLHKVDLIAAPAAKKESADPPAKKPDAKKPDVKKAADAAKRQPPDSSKRGADNDNQKIDIANISDEEFDKLPESTKAKYRGDEF